MINVIRTNSFGQRTELVLPVTEEQLRRWEGGELVQNVFPHLTPQQREFLITGDLPGQQIFDEGFDAEAALMMLLEDEDPGTHMFTADIVREDGTTYEYNTFNSSEEKFVEHAVRSQGCRREDVTNIRSKEVGDGQ